MNKLPKCFIVAATVGLLWNLLGCFAFVSDLQISPQDLAKLSQAQQALYNARPTGPWLQPRLLFSAQVTLAVVRRGKRKHRNEPTSAVSQFGRAGAIHRGLDA